MPKRSNEFQRIVAAAQQMFSLPNAKITSPALITSILGIQREIDLLIEVNSGLETYSTAIEAKDHKRPLDSTAIDEIIGKYQDLPIKNIIVVSRKFTSNAIKKAKAFGIKCQTISSFEEEAKGIFKSDNSGIKQKKSNNKFNYQWVLFDTKGQRVDENIAFNGNVIKNNVNYGKALKIAMSQRPTFIDEVEEERKKKPGCFVSGKLTIEFKEYMLKLDHVSIEIGILEVFVQQALIIPDLTPKNHLYSGSLQSKNITTETATNETGHYTIVYEKPEMNEPPKSFSFRFEDHKGNSQIPKFMYLVQLSME